MDFSFIEPKKCDFVYLDQPYHQSGEWFYTRLPFDEKGQIRLRDFVYELNNKGVKMMLSNNNTTFIKTYTKTFSSLIFQSHTQSMNNVILIFPIF